MENPLLRDSGAHRLPAFDDFRPNQVLPAIDELLGRYRAGMDALLQTPGNTDWSLVAAEVDFADAVARAWSPVSHLYLVADDAELREAYNSGLEKLTAHESWRQQNESIFAAYSALKDSEKWPQLSSEQRRIVELELRDFRLSGVALPAEQKQRYRELMMRLSKLGSKFSENLLDATQAWTLQVEDPEKLNGLPDAEMNLLAGIAKQQDKSGWMIDLNAPSFHAVMTYAADRDLRREVYQAYVTRASDQGPSAGEWDNQPVIEEVLRLRHELALLLGFDNYAEYALARRMAESPKQVLEFLQTLAARARPAARKQLAELEQFAHARGADVPLQAWDVAYWSERFRQSELQLSDEELKPYFPAERMIEALEYTAQELFGIRLVADESISTWHSDVRYFWLQDDNGKNFAGIYMDLFARADKRSGAWMDVCLSRRKLENGLQKPVAYLTCNFSPPVNDQPSLLTHRDVETLFHEFGHCLHHLLTRVDWPQINGISNVEWDAVELPSQLLENWCWQDEILARFARHYQKDEQLPEILKQRLLKSRGFQGGLFLVRQLEYALADFRMHLEFDPQRPRHPLDLLKEVREQVAVIPVPEWNRFLNGFGHIFAGGYAAGYYSYLWAEQLSADAWGRFLEEGALNVKTGMALKQEILEVGSSRPAMESFVAFRGRKPEAAPLLRLYGLE